MTTLLERFWAKVDTSGSCWIWTSMVAGQRYGRFRVHGKKILAHRFSYETFNGAIPDGADICHTCDNDSCVKPTHLFAASHQENMRDASRKGRIARGERVAKAKLNEAIVRDIRWRRSMGQTTVAIAADYGINSGTVSRIARRESWRHAA